MTWRSAIDLRSGQQRVGTALSAVLVGLSDEIAEHRPVPTGLSIAELLAHLLLSEQRVASDMELMLREEWPELPSIGALEEPGRLRALVAQAGSLAMLRLGLEAASQRTLGLVEQLTEEQERRGGHSPELGNVLLGHHALCNTLYHALGHIEEMRAIRRQLGLGSGQPLGLPGLASL
jgi:hypothetical protein